MEQWPENPLEHVADYFGNYRDEEAWALLDQLKAENAESKAKVPELEAKIKSLMEEVQQASRMTRTGAIYKGLDPDGTNSVSTKAFIEKISGNKKFEIDLPLSKRQFYFMLACCAGLPDYEAPPKEGEGEAEPAPEAEGEQEEKEPEDPVEIFSQIADAFEQPDPVYASDQENPLYLRICERLKDFVPPEDPKEPEPEGEGEQAKE